MLVIEGVDSNLIIIVIESKVPTRLINIYRNFNPQHNVSQRKKFKYQLSFIKNAIIKRTIMMSDFNLDFPQKDKTAHTEGPA